MHSAKLPRIWKIDWKASMQRSGRVGQGVVQGPPLRADGQYQQPATAWR